MDQFTRNERTPSLIPFPIGGDYNLFDEDEEYTPPVRFHPLATPTGVVDWMYIDISYGFDTFTDAELSAILSEKCRDISITNLVVETAI